MTTERSRRARSLVLTALAATLGLLALGHPAHAASVPVATWTALTTPTAPPARQAAAMAYDGATNQIVLFGGLSGGGNLLNDTWLWNGSSWSRANPTSSPSPREGASLAYDADLHEMILFGGITQVAATSGTPTLSSETWAWNGASWFPLAPTASPPARSGAVLTGEDTTSGQFVLFGGSGLAADGVTPVTLADTWTFDGTTWTEQQPATSPPARDAAAAAWDAHLGEVVLFGGDGTSGWLGDTWTWSGAIWTRQTPAESPPARGGSTLAYDADLGGDALFGGQANSGLLGDTWVYTGTTWTEVPAAGAPGPRSSSAAAWDSASHQLLLFGGAAGSTAVYGDTSVLTVTPPHPGPSHPTTTTTTVPPVPTHRTPTTTAPPRPQHPASTTTVPPRHHVVATTTTVPSTRPPAATSAPPPTPVTPAPLTSTARTVHIGESITLSGGGFASGAMVTITFHSFPSTVVGFVHADGLGQFTAVVSVPKEAPAGAHHFEATGRTADGQLVVLTTAIQVVATHATGSHRTETVVMLALAILIPAITWLVLSLHSRRSRRSRRGPAAT